MNYLIISFKNRTTLMEFNKFLLSHGASTTLINTPRKISVSCGLSIKTGVNNFNPIVNVLRHYKPESFVGVFLVEQKYNNEFIKRIF